MSKLKVPFNMIVSGATECGKTFYVLNYLLEHHKGDFDYIFIVCPTLSWNKTYIELLPAEERIYLCECEKVSVDATLRMIMKHYKDDLEKTLIIIDDCASTQDVKNRTGTLVKLAFSGRHWGMSTITITQQITSINKPTRENLARMVTFYNHSAEDMKKIRSAFLSSVSNEEFARICKELKEVKWAKLIIDMRWPYGHYIE